MTSPPQIVRSRTLKDRVVATVILACMGLALFWLVMSSIARRPWEAFQLTFEDFDGFRPSVADAELHKLQISAHPLEPNIVGFRYQVACGDVYIRLVHGYNMVDCMRIKGYEAQLLADSRNPEQGGSATNTALLPYGIQVWRLTSPEGDVSIWATSILDAVSFEKTSTDVRAMLFPRVGIPNAAGFAPRGLTWDSLEDPIGTFRLFLRAEWNSSRSDLLTFLKLKRPAWASERMLTLVSRTGHRAVDTASEPEAVRRVVSAHELLHRELFHWRTANPRRETP